MTQLERKNPVKSSGPFATSMGREPCSQVARLSRMNDLEGIIENTLPDPLTVGGDARGRGSGEWGWGWGQEVAKLLQRKGKNELKKGVFFLILELVQLRIIPYTGIRIDWMHDIRYLSAVEFISWGCWDSFFLATRMGAKFPWFHGWSWDESWHVSGSVKIGAHDELQVNWSYIYIYV